MNYPEVVQEALIKEAPHTTVNNAPQELDYLTKGVVDFGFENLNLNESQYKEIMLGFSGDGVVLTGFNLIIRANFSFGASIEKPRKNLKEYPQLPENWQEAVLVMSLDDKIIYAGDLVRKNQKSIP